MKRALVALDISDISYSIIRFVFPFARRHKIFHLDFIHVREEEPENMLTQEGYPENMQSGEKTGRYRILEDMISNVLDSITVEETSFNLIIKTGDILEEILLRSSEICYEFIILGKSRKSDLDTLFEGSLQNSLIMESPCPLLIFAPRKEKWFIT